MQLRPGIGRNSSFLAVLDILQRSPQLSKLSVPLQALTYMYIHCHTRWALIRNSINQHPLLVTPGQLTRPCIGQNSSRAMGDFGFIHLGLFTYSHRAVRSRYWPYRVHAGVSFNSAPTLSNVHIPQYVYVPF